MKINQNNTGLAAEKLAATFLVSHGLKMVAQNYHCRYGEIDLIMTEAKTLVFIEVRLRTNTQFANAATSITPQKQKKLILTAQHYLQAHGEQLCRFDAVLMSRVNLQDLEWIRNAFEA